MDTTYGPAEVTRYFMHRHELLECNYYCDEAAGVHANIIWVFPERLGTDVSEILEVTNSELVKLSEAEGAKINRDAVYSDVDGNAHSPSEFANAS